MTMPAASDNEAQLDRDLADIAQPIATAARAPHPGWLCRAAMKVCPSRPV
jgi:hypothetical protein